MKVLPIYESSKGYDAFFKLLYWAADFTNALNLYNSKEEFDFFFPIVCIKFDWFFVISEILPLSEVWQAVLKLGRPKPSPLKAVQTETEYICLGINSSK